MFINAICCYSAIVWPGLMDICEIVYRVFKVCCLSYLRFKEPSKYCLTLEVYIIAIS